MKTPIEKVAVVAGIAREMIEGRDGRPQAKVTTAVSSSQNSSNLGSYQTAPLTDYRSEHRDLAERVFVAAAAQLRSSLAHRYKGSYSFFGSQFRDTVAKIIIFERGLGRMNHDFPIDRDGVYILLRVHGDTDTPTIGVAPTHVERFTYRLVTEADVDAVVKEIVDAVASPVSHAVSSAT